MPTHLRCWYNGKKQRQNKALGENKKKNKKKTDGQKSTTTSRIHNKPTHYEASSVCDNNSLARPYRVNVQNVSMRSEFSLDIFSTRIRLSVFLAVSSHAILYFPPLNRQFCKHK